MNRAVSLILQTGVPLSAAAGIFFAIRIILEQTIGGSRYWGGAMAAGPALFAIPLYVFERRAVRVPKRSEAVR